MRTQKFDNAILKFMWKGLTVILSLMIVATVALAFIPRAQAQQPQPDVLKFQECYQRASTMGELILVRAAGLSLDEARTMNEFDVRVLRFVAQEYGAEFYEEGIAELDKFTVTVYELDEAIVNDPKRREAWTIQYFDDCTGVNMQDIPQEETEDPMLRMFPQDSAI